MTEESASPHDKPDHALLLGVVVFGAILLGAQVLAIVIGGFEIAAHSSLSLAALSLAETPQWEMPYSVYGICAGFAWLLLSSAASAALALPVTAAHQPLQRMLLSGLLLASVGWQSALIFEYLEGSPGQLLGAAALILLLSGLPLILSRRRWPMGKEVKPGAVAVLLTVLAALAILVGYYGADSHEELQTIFILLLSLLIMACALHQRQRARRQGSDARAAAYLFQAWLQTFWMPVPYFFAYID